MKITVSAKDNLQFRNFRRMIRQQLDSGTITSIFQQLYCNTLDAHSQIIHGSVSKSFLHSLLSAGICDFNQAR